MSVCHVVATRAFQTHDEASNETPDNDSIGRAMNDKSLNALK